MIELDLKSDNFIIMFIMFLLSSDVHFNVIYIDMHDPKSTLPLYQKGLVR